MRRILSSVLLSALLVSTSALADDDYGIQQPSSDTQSVAPSDSSTQQPGAADDRYIPGETTTAEASDVTRGYLGNEVAAIRPVAGLINFTDANGESTARGGFGLLFDMNAMSVISPEMNNVYFGPQTGLFYSHMGSPTSTFFGNNPSASDASPGANMFLIPANLKIGYTWADKYRFAVHGGGNVIYRSVASSAAFGDSSSVPGSVWRIFPNVGVDADLGFSKSVALTVRPDLTFTPGDLLFTGMVGLGISLG